MKVNHSGSAIVTVSNNFLISLWFHSIPKFLGFPLFIYIWFYRGWLLIPYSNEYCTGFFINLVLSKIFFPSIFQYWMDSCSWIKKDDTNFGSISYLTIMFWPISLLLYTFCECFTPIASTEIQLYSQFNYIIT